MTRREAAIITAYTGILIGTFHDFHIYAEAILDRPLWTYHFAGKRIWAELKQAAKEDFIMLNENIE